MDIQEIKKTKINKNLIIILLSVALLIVSSIAISQAHHSRSYKNGFEGGRHLKGGMMREGRVREFNSDKNQLPPAPEGTSTVQ